MTEGGSREQEVDSRRRQDRKRSRQTEAEGRHRRKKQAENTYVEGIRCRQKAVGDRRKHGEAEEGRSRAGEGLKKGRRG